MSDGQSDYYRNLKVAGIVIKTNKGTYATCPHCKHLNPTYSHLNVRCLSCHCDFRVK